MIHGRARLRCIGRRWSSTAPGTEGYYGLEARFLRPGLRLPHGEAAYSFGFKTARPPEHVVTVEVIDKASQTPITNADVLLYPYRGSTDKSGVARVSVSKGEHEVLVSAHDKQTFQTTVNVAGDMAIKAELLVRCAPGGNRPATEEDTATRDWLEG